MNITRKTELRLPIRVCFLIDNLTTAGVETQLVSLVRQLDPDKIAPVLCVLHPRSAAAASLAPDNCPVHWLGVTHGWRHPRTLRQALEFARFLRREKIQVLNMDLPASIMFGVPVGWMAGVPRLIRTRRGLGDWMNDRERRVARWMSNFVDLTLVNCEACRTSVLEIERPRAETVVMLRNDIDLSEFQSIPCPTPSDNKSPRVVGIVANLRPVKAPDLFVQAAAIIAQSHHDVVFRMVGQGDMRPQLEQQISDMGLAGRVQLLGRIADLPAFLQTLDVAVLSSHSEGLSCSLLEYMAAARPIVATRVGGTVEIIQDQVHGLLVPPGSASALADGIASLLRDRPRAVQLANAARAHVADQYGGPNIAERYQEIIFQLCDISAEAAMPDAKVVV